MIAKTLLLCLIISQIYCVGVPLMTRKSRCMMAYTDEALETLKLDIHFPPLPDQTDGEQYQVSITSTETSETTSETIVNGNYKKEVTVEPSIIFLTKIIFIGFASEFSAVGMSAYKWLSTMQRLNTPSLPQLSKFLIAFLKMV